MWDGTVPIWQHLQFAVPSRRPPNPCCDWWSVVTWPAELSVLPCLHHCFLISQNSACVPQCVCEQALNAG
ncbi:uncharacterized [Tachysurus ichikawai]